MSGAKKKLTLKAYTTCNKCKDQLFKQIHGVKGVQKVEILNDCCPTFTVTGTFEVEDVLKATGENRKCLKVESVEIIPPPAPPPKPATPAAPPKAPVPAAPAKPPAAPAKKPDPPKVPATLPPGSNLIINIQKVIFCPRGSGACDCHDCH